MNIKNLIKSVINENYDVDKTKKLEDFIVDNIDTTYFEELFNKTPKSDDEKIIMGLKSFVEEFGPEIKRTGVKRAFLEYLKSLPTWLSIPHTTYEIKNLLYSLGYDEAKTMGEPDLSDLYYKEIAEIFLSRLKDKEIVLR